jgi:hypothetical protein
VIGGVFRAAIDPLALLAVRLKHVTARLAYSLAVRLQAREHGERIGYLFAAELIRVRRTGGLFVLCPLKQSGRLVRSFLLGGSQCRTGQ